MAHTIFNGTHCAYWDVDSYNMVGIAAADIDNGTFLTLGDMKLKDATGGYEFTVLLVRTQTLLLALLKLAMVLKHRFMLTPAISPTRLASPSLSSV